MRKFMVILDDSRECLNAMRFAAMRAAHTGGGVTILSVIPPDEFNHWIGVGEVMREEARERIHAHFEVFAKWIYHIRTQVEICETSYRRMLHERLHSTLPPSGPSVARKIDPPHVET